VGLEERRLALGGEHGPQGGERSQPSSAKQPNSPNPRPPFPFRGRSVSAAGELPQHFVDLIVVGAGALEVGVPEGHPGTKAIGDVPDPVIADRPGRCRTLTRNSPIQCSPSAEPRARPTPSSEQAPQRPRHGERMEPGGPEAWDRLNPGAPCAPAPSCLPSTGRAPRPARSGRRMLERYGKWNTASSSVGGRRPGVGASDRRTDEGLRHSVPDAKLDRGASSQAGDDRPGFQHRKEWPQSGCGASPRRTFTKAVWGASWGRNLGPARICRPDPISRKHQAAGIFRDGFSNWGRRATHGSAPSNCAAT